jgi:CRP-like cAMP-binding protein
MQYSDPHIELCLENPDSIFRGLQNRDKETIIKHLAKSTVRKGDFIYSEGEKARGLICLCEGKCKIYRVGVGGREQILKLIKPGEIIGYRNLFQPAVWTNSAVAIEDAAVCHLDKNSIVALLKHNQEFAFRLMKLMADEVLFYQERVISLTQKHVRGRVAETLLMLAEIYGFEQDGKTINVIMSRDDIAHHSNMTTSNAIRTLSNLSGEGKIETRKKKIKLIDIPALELISKAG